MISGAQIVIDELKRQNVDMVFAYPGASILSIYDKLFNDNTIKHILPVDERGAIFMANGYARSSNKVGVCLATSGPGATNLITGIADAFMDSVPLVVITGNVPLNILGYDSFQEVDTTGITTPITKYNFIVKNINELAPAISNAFKIANSGRRGPVLIDIPSNILDEEIENITSYNLSLKDVEIDKNEISVAKDIINNSQHPLIYVGGGVSSSGAQNLALNLSKKLNAPIGVSLMGIGSVPSTFKNYIGVGTSINRLAKEVVKKCDTIISLGARFSTKAMAKSPYSKNTKLVHLDIDRAEIDKIVTAEGPVCGDLNKTLPLLIDSVNSKDETWLNEVLSLKDEITEKKSTHQRYIEVINDKFKNEQIVTTDVGQHQLWTANYYHFDKPKKFLTSGGLGAMGFGLSTAIGAYFATHQNIVTITGDGSFNLSLNELLTVKNYNIPVTIFVMNNQSLGLIRENQKLNYHGNIIDADLPSSVDYKYLAKAYDIPYYTAKSPDNLCDLLKNIDILKPAIIDLTINKNEKSL